MGCARMGVRCCDALVVGLLVAALVVFRFEHLEFPQVYEDDEYTHIVVAGAWLLPDATMSQTFHSRIARAVQLHRDHPRATLVFTGGLNDSVAALAHARTALGGCVAPLACVYENASRSTLGNAEEVASLLLGARGGDGQRDEVEAAAEEGGGARSSGAVLLVVSTPYHLARCLVYFSRFFARVDVAPAPDLAREPCAWRRKQLDVWWDTDSLCLLGGMLGGSMLGGGDARADDDNGRRKLCVVFPRARLAWLRPCVVGQPFVGAAREVGAWLHNLALGRLALADAEFAWRRYMHRPQPQVGAEGIAAVAAGGRRSFSSAPATDE